jgi:hypothetical protein
MAEKVYVDFIGGLSAGRHCASDLSMADDGAVAVKAYAVHSNGLDLVRHDVYRRSREAAAGVPARYTFVESRTVPVE